MYAGVHNICLTYTPAHAWCATTPVNACRLSVKNAYGLVYVRLFNCAAASLPWKLTATDYRPSNDADQRVAETSGTAICNHAEHQSSDESNTSRRCAYSSVEERGMSERSIESYGKLNVFDSDDSPDGW